MWDSPGPPSIARQSWPAGVTSDSMPERASAQHSPTGAKCAGPSRAGLAIGLTGLLRRQATGLIGGPDFVLARASSSGPVLATGGMAGIVGGVVVGGGMAGVVGRHHRWWRCGGRRRLGGGRPSRRLLALPLQRGGAAAEHAPSLLGLEGAAVDGDSSESTAFVPRDDLEAAVSMPRDSPKWVAAVLHDSELTARLATIFAAQTPGPGPVACLMGRGG